MVIISMLLSFFSQFFPIQQQQPQNSNQIMPNPMLMSPEMGGVSGGGNTNTNNSQVSQLANTLGLNASGPNSTGPLVSDKSLSQINSIRSVH